MSSISGSSSSYTGCTQESLSVSASAKNQLLGNIYDAAGDLTSIPGIASYNYDAESRLCSVGGTSCTTGTVYTYDGDGKRVMKSGGKIYWYGTGSDPLIETDLSGAWQFTHYYFGGMRIARRESNNWVDHYGLDHLGNARIVYGNNGGWDQSDFYPFGGERVISSAAGSRYKFTGKERDSESGLDNFGARYNSSQYGRFMTPDPLLNSGRPWDPQTWNRYAYARNNPLNIIDPTGLYDLNNTCATANTKCNKQFNQHAQDLRTGRSDLQNKVNKMKDGPEKQRLQGSLNALGTEGDHNGVNVSFGAVANGAAQTDPVYNQQTGQETYNVTFDPSKISSTNGYAIDAAHEGTHVSDFQTELANPNGQPELSLFSLEYRGYQTSAFAASALGVGSLSFTYDGRSSVIWNGSWGAVDRNITNFVTRFHDESGKPTHTETTPHNPWPN